MKLHIKKDDMVIVLAGKDKGKKGKITKAFPKEGKVIVEGVNVHKKHGKARRSNAKGAVVDLAMPIDASKVRLVK